MALRVADKEVHIYTGGRRGSEAQPVVVFIHGAGHDHSVWNLQCRYFASHGWSVLAPDLPGHGRSQGAPAATLEETAAWLLAMLDAAGVSRAALVGHSMGSLIALEVAARAPERATALSLVGSAVPMPVAPPLLAAAQDDRAAAHAMINQWSFSPAAQHGTSAVPGMAQTIVNLRLMERQREGVLHADLSACNAYQRGTEAAAMVRCPTLLVCGERDQMTPLRAAAPLRDALGDVRVHLIPNCGHAIMAERPDALTDALAGFLNKL